MKRLKFSGTLIVPAILFLPFHHAAQAYIDPGTGSIVLQTVIGAFAAVLVAVGMFWKQIKAFIGNLFSRSKKSEESKEQ